MPKMKETTGLLSQAELAPTEMILTDTRHVGATFGCDQIF
jgi:hypothetical protein